MRKIIDFIFFYIAVGLGMFAAAQAPQIPVTGNLGAGGNFPAINSPSVVFATDANHTMAYPEMSGSSGFLKVTSTGSLTTTRDLIVPLTKGFQWTIENLTTGGQSIRVIGASGTGITIANGSTVTVAADGTNVVQSGVSGGSGTVSGQTTGCLPKASSATALTGPSSVCDDGTTVSTTEAHRAASYTATGPNPMGGTAGSVGVGQGTFGTSTLPANQILDVAPTSVSTSYAEVRPAAVPTTGQVRTVTAVNSVTGGSQVVEGWATPSGGGAGNPTTCTANSTNYKCIGVSPYLAVSGDWTTAFQQAISDLHTAGGGTIGVPCSSSAYNVNGAPQDTGGANAILILAAVPEFSVPFDYLEIDGLCPVGGLTQDSQIALQTTNNTAGVNILGGFATGGSNFNFANTRVILKNIRFVNPGNPSSNGLDATWFPAIQTENVWTNTATGAAPTTGTGVGMKLPTLSNDVDISIGPNYTSVGYAVGIVPGEHATLYEPHCANETTCIELSAGGTSSFPHNSNSITVLHPWAQVVTNLLSAGPTYPSTVQVISADAEAVDHVLNDSSNLIQGYISYEVPHNQAGVTYCNPNNVGGANPALQMVNLQCPGVQVDQQGGNINFFQPTYGASADVSITHPSNGLLHFNFPDLGVNNYSNSNLISGLASGHGDYNLVGISATAHNAAAVGFFNATVPYTRLESFGGVDPVQLWGTQFYFKDGPMFVGNNSFNGAALLTAPGVLNIGSSSQAYFDASGNLTVPSCTGCSGFPIAGTGVSITNPSSGNVAINGITTVNATGSTGVFPFQWYQPSLSTGQQTFMVFGTAPGSGTAAAFGWTKATLSYADIQTYDPATSPIDYFAKQHYFHGGPVFFGNSTAAGSGLYTAPGACLDVGTTAQLYADCSGNLTTSGTMTAGVGTMPLYDTSGAAQTSPHQVVGSVTLSGAPTAVTLTGSAVFASSSSYSCAISDSTGLDAGSSVTYSSGSSFTVAGTGTNVYRFICVGN